MGEHAAHLRAAAETGTVLVAGPVGDPAGPWGLGVIHAGSLEEARAFTNEDPMIKANAGFSYDIHPMLSAIVGRPNPEKI